MKEGALSRIFFSWGYGVVMLGTMVESVNHGRLGAAANGTYNLMPAWRSASAEGRLALQIALE